MKDEQMTFYSHLFLLDTQKYHINVQFRFRLFMAWTRDTLSDRVSRRQMIFLPDLDRCQPIPVLWYRRYLLRR